MCVGRHEKSLWGDAAPSANGERSYPAAELVSRLKVDCTSVTNWETGRHMPDVVTISLLAETLGVDTATLMSAAEEPVEPPNILLVDDKPIILEGGLPTLREVMPNANVVGFTNPVDVMDNIG